MNLYTHKESNIRRTWFLFFVFFVVIIGIGWVFSQIYGNPVILVFFVLFSVGMSFVSYWYSDKIVLKISKAKKVEKKDFPELYNILENLSITAGLPMPRLFLMDEKAPNAFATGRNPEHAVVAVTQGLVDCLDRSELEGVLAHELSHIGNRDMLLSTVVVVLVGFIALLSDFFLRSFFWGGIGRDRDRGQAGGYLMMIGIALAVLAPFATMLIQLAISRKREYLADASGALLTRYPEGLANALEKISRDTAPLRVANKATNHLWLASPRKSVFKNKAGGLFMTHPPAEERVKRLRNINI
ncbi:M48 family metallopeptidase [Patescibacteria group bacterium]|nr:M48 family metallopeptidase [Patescibacteria group bacterium]MBU2633432.1 M48 family metallopeptidase [Patescibacteria group bacterium]